LKKIDNIFSQVEWSKFFDMVYNIGDELNTRKNRFDKSDILELAVETFSDGKIIHVDKQGWDHECEI